MVELILMQLMDPHATIGVDEVGLQDPPLTTDRPNPDNDQFESASRRPRAQTASKRPRPRIPQKGQVDSVDIADCLSLDYHPSRDEKVDLPFGGLYDNLRSTRRARQTSSQGPL